MAAVALARLVAQRTGAAAIATARSPEQLADLVTAPDRGLSDDDLAQLGAAMPRRGVGTACADAGST